MGVGMRSHAGVALKMFEILAKENIHMHLISTSEIKISCVIDAKYAELAVRALHDGFGLREKKKTPLQRGKFFFFFFVGSRDKVEDQQLDRMRAAVRASPRSTAFVALAHALCDAGLAAEAEVVSRQGLAHHPDLPTGQVALARAWLECGKLVEAETALRRTLRQHPRHADAYFWLAETLTRSGRGVEGLAIWPRARDAVASREPLPTDLQRLASGGPPAAPAPPRRPREARQAFSDAHDEDPTKVTDLRGLARRSTDRRAKVGPAPEETTPTGSFPPISVTADAAAAFRQSQGVAWSRWALVSVVALIVALGIVQGSRRRDPPATEGAAGAPLLAVLEADLAAGTLKRLLHARDVAQRHLARQPRDEETRVTLAYVRALLAYQHGIDADNKRAQDSNELTTSAPSRSSGARRDAPGLWWLWSREITTPRLRRPRRRPRPRQTTPTSCWPPPPCATGAATWKPP